MKPYRIFILIAICSLFSCNRERDIDYIHPEYFNSVFTTADELNGKNAKHTLPFLDSAFKAFPHPGIKDLYHKYNAIASYYIDIDRSDSLSMRYVDSMLWVIRKHTNEKEFINEYANALFKKGNLLIWKQDYNNAFECNYKARQAIEKTHDTCLLSAYSSTLSVVCYQEGKYQEAANLMKATLAEMSSCPNDYRKFKIIQARYDDIGSAYNHLNMLDSSLHYYNLALSYLEAHADSFPTIEIHPQFTTIAEAVVYGNMGDIYLKQGDSVTAEKLYIQDIDTNARPGYDYGDADCTREKLARLYICQKKYAKVDTLLREIPKTLDTTHNRYLQLELCRLQMEYYEKTGQGDKAEQSLAPYLRIRSMLDAVKQIPQVDVQEEYERIKGQYDLMIAEKKNDIKDHYLAIALCFSIIAIIIAFIFWNNWKRTRKLIARTARQNSQMELALDSLTESQQENTRIMQVVAHDLRNPIASMIAIISILQDNENLPDDDREMLELMNTASHHALDMITDLMSIDTTDEGMKKEPADMKLLLRYSVELVQFKASEKDQKIILETEQATLVVSREKIWRVISNLLVNAIKFSPRGSNIYITGTRTAQEFIITIRDNGIGIPDKMKNNIFDRFTDAKRIGTAGEKSFGLGLSISRQIVEAHGGDIRFESQEGVGTTFFVALPLHDKHLSIPTVEL